MFGWEFPPHISGGLKTACFGLTKGLASFDDIDLTFVIPKVHGMCSFGRIVVSCSWEKRQAQTRDAQESANAPSPQAKTYQEQLKSVLREGARGPLKPRVRWEHGIWSQPAPCSAWRLRRFGQSSKRCLECGVAEKLFVTTHPERFSVRAGTVFPALADRAHFEERD